MSDESKEDASPSERLVFVDSNGREWIIRESAGIENPEVTDPIETAYAEAMMARYATAACQPEAMCGGVERRDHWWIRAWNWLCHHAPRWMRLRPMRMPVTVPPEREMVQAINWDGQAIIAARKYAETYGLTN